VVYEILAKGWELPGFPFGSDIQEQPEFCRFGNLRKGWVA